MKIEESANAIGAGLSLACAAHCIAMPLLLALAPLASLEIWIDDGIEAALLVLSVTLSVANLCWGYRVHRQPRVFAPLVVALAALAVSEIARHPWHAVWVVGGAGLLAASQLLNRRLCRSCHDCDVSVES